MFVWRKNVCSHHIIVILCGKHILMYNKAYNIIKYLFSYFTRLQLWWLLKLCWVYDRVSLQDKNDSKLVTVRGINKYVNLHIHWQNMHGRTKCYVMCSYCLNNILFEKYYIIIHTKFFYGRITWFVFFILETILLIYFLYWKCG